MSSYKNPHACHITSLLTTRPCITPMHTPFLTALLLCSVTKLNLYASNNADCIWWTVRWCKMIFILTYKFPLFFHNSHYKKVGTVFSLLPLWLEQCFIYRPPFQRGVQTAAQTHVTELHSELLSSLGCTGREANNGDCGWKWDETPELHSAYFDISLY